MNLAKSPKDKSKLYKFNDDGIINFICHKFYQPNPTLQDRFFPVSYCMPGIDTVLIDDKPTKIRYIIGETSIIASEQSNPKAEDDARVAPIYFVDGLLQVRRQESTLLEFLKRTNRNAYCESAMPKSIATFMPWQSELKAQEKIDDFELIHRAQARLLRLRDEEGWDSVKAFAETLEIPIRANSEVQASLWQYIEKKPQDFLDAIDSVKMKRKYHVMQAVKRQVLAVDVSTNSLMWKDAGVIIRAPFGVSPIDIFVDGIDDKYSVTYNEIKNRMGSFDLTKPKVEETDEDLIKLREEAKGLKIQGYHLLGLEKLKEKIAAAKAS